MLIFLLFCVEEFQQTATLSSALARYHNLLPTDHSNPNVVGHILELLELEQIGSMADIITTINALEVIPPAVLAGRQDIIINLWARLSADKKIILYRRLPTSMKIALSDIPLQLLHQEDVESRKMPIVVELPPAAQELRASEVLQQLSGTSAALFYRMLPEDVRNQESVMQAFRQRFIPIPDRTTPPQEPSRLSLNLSSPPILQRFDPIQSLVNLENLSVDELETPLFNSWLKGLALSPHKQVLFYTLMPPAFRPRLAPVLREHLHDYASILDQWTSPFPPYTYEPSPLSEKSLLLALDKVLQQIPQPSMSFVDALDHVRQKTDIPGHFLFKALSNFEGMGAFALPFFSFQSIEDFARILPRFVALLEDDQQPWHEAYRSSEARWAAVAEHVFYDFGKERYMRPMPILYRMVSVLRMMKPTVDGDLPTLVDLLGCKEWYQAFAIYQLLTPEDKKKPEAINHLLSFVKTIDISHFQREQLFSALPKDVFHGTLVRTAISAKIEYALNRWPVGRSKEILTFMEQSPAFIRPPEDVPFVQRFPEELRNQAYVIDRFLAKAEQVVPGYDDWMSQESSENVATLWANIPSSCKLPHVALRFMQHPHFIGSNFDQAYRIAMSEMDWDIVARRLEGGLAITDPEVMEDIGYRLPPHIPLDQLLRLVAQSRLSDTLVMHLWYGLPEDIRYQRDVILNFFPRMARSRSIPEHLAPAWYTMYQSLPAADRANRRNFASYILAMRTHGQRVSSTERAEWFDWLIPHLNEGMQEILQGQLNIYPQEEEQPEQPRGRGLAYESHNFVRGSLRQAEALIRKVPTSFTYPRVMEYIRTKMDQLLNETDLRPARNAWQRCTETINSLFPEYKDLLPRIVALLEDENQPWFEAYRNQPELRWEMWLKGSFVESGIAYAVSGNQISCPIGIKERLTTALRVLHEGFAAVFQSAEAELCFFSSINEKLRQLQEELRDNPRRVELFDQRVERMLDEMEATPEQRNSEETREMIRAVKALL